MSVILNQSESENQRGLPATEVTTVIGGDLTIPAGTHLAVQGIVRLESVLTIEDGGGLTISDAPTAPRLFSRQDAERLLAEDSLPSAAEVASWRSLADSLEIGKAPAMMAAVEHLSAWYTATDRQAEAVRLIGALTAPTDNTLQQMLALGEIEGWLKPRIALGDLSQGVNAMIALGDLVATSPTMLEAARLQHERATAAIGAVRRMVEQPAMAAVEAALRMVEPTVQSLAEQQRQLAAALAFVQPGLQFDAADMLAGYGGAWIEPPVQAPARRPVLAPPAQPVIVEVVQVASTDWREALAAALQDGKASPQEVIAWLRGMSRPGQKPPDWVEVEAVAVMYKQHGHRYKDYETFVSYLALKGIAISVGTLKRRLALYEAATGERLRPGKGRRKLL